MKYSPKELSKNVNVSSKSPLKDFLDLALRIVGALLVVYIVSGWMVDYFAPRISPGLEAKIDGMFSGYFKEDQRTRQEDQIQEILDELVKKAEGLPEKHYLVHIKDEKIDNAIALPGGHIVIFSDLLKDVTSQNELAMVLSHELGHFAYRDHLSGLGRQLIGVVISAAVFGSDPSTTQFITSYVSAAEGKFSQAQEKRADLYALELLNNYYGHIAGAEDYFRRVADKEKVWPIFYIFDSHPASSQRAQTLSEAIGHRGYRVGAKLPFTFQAIQTQEKSEKRFTG